ncbi:hypothetical protein [Marinobacter sp. OP 3.4]|uniref:hypothetical protein n=1 Tax=Marinobacter sp. OP 3.4 TaxID=3076501 RepID=UPI002E1AF98E
MLFCIFPNGWVAVWRALQTVQFTTGMSYAQPDPIAFPVRRRQTRQEFAAYDRDIGNNLDQGQQITVYKALKFCGMVPAY